MKQNPTPIDTTYQVEQTRSHELPQVKIFSYGMLLKTFLIACMKMMGYFSRAPFSMNTPISFWKKGVTTSLTLLLLVVGMNVGWGQTYFNLSTSNYSETFTSWTVYGANWNGLAANAGTIPNATSITVVSTNLGGVVGSGGSVGIDAASSTKLVILSTGSTDNSTSAACDLNLNFSGRNAGNLSFDAATIFNSTGNRVSSLKVYYSTNGTAWTELTGTNLPFVATNNVVGSASINIALPSALNNQSTVKLRFYYHNGSGGSTGSRPRISLDNVAVTSTATGPSITGAATTTAFTTTYGTASSVQTFTVGGTGLSTNLVATAPTGFQVSSDGTTYGSTASFTQSGGTASGSLRIRLAATASVTGSYNNQNIVLSSTGATSVNITTPASGNSVTAASLTITGLTANNKTYDGLTTATVTGTSAYSGLVNGETFTVTGTPAFTFNNALVGTSKPVTVTGYTEPSTNYTLTQPSGLTANITAAALTITGLSGVDKVYDRLTTATLSGTPSYLGLQNSETFTVTGSGVASFLDALVGTGKTINVTGYTAPTSNYTVSQPSGITASITSKSLTISGLTADNKLFDGNTTATLSGTPSLVGVISPDVVTVTGTYTADFNDATVGTGKPVTVTGYGIAGADAGNYSVSQPSGLTADITSSPSPVITSALTATGIYGNVLTYTITATETPTSYNATGLPSGLTVNTTNGIISGTPTVLGTFSTTISATNAGGTGSATLVFTINPKTLTVTGATASNKVYDGDATATINGSTLVGIVGADDVTINTSGSFATKNVATAIAVTSSQTLGGADAAKYVLTIPTGLSADITAKALTVSGATVTSKLYDGLTSATITGSTLVGVVSPDVVTVSGNGTFASANVGTAIVVTPTLVLGGADAGNYSLTQPTGLTGNITTAPLIITGVTADNKVYDATNVATLSGTPAYVGLQNGETFTVTGTPVATFNNKIVGTAKPVTVIGYDVPSTNYTVTQPTLTANVTTANLTVSGATADNKVYNRTTVATITGSVLVGVLGSDVVDISGTGTFASANVGTAIAVTSTQTLSGVDASNYTLTIPTSLTANITPKALTISSAAAQNKVFDGNTTATITGTLTGVIAPDVVTSTLSGTFASSAVGTGIAVTSTSTIGGADAGNYSLTQPTGLSANITLAIVPLLQWNTFGNAGTETTEASVFNNTNIAASNLTLGSGVTAAANANRFGGANWFNTGDTNPSTLANAISGNDYIQFIVTPNVGFSFTPTTFVFNWDKSGTGPQNVALRSSVDNYAANLGTVVPTAAIGTANSITISGLNNITNATTFRVYGYGATATGGTGGIDVNSNIVNVELNGTILAAATPTISTTGTLAALSTTYGTASSETSFNVSGIDMTAGVLVTPPAGYEVSLTSGSGFASTVTVGAAGTIASTPVYVRLTTTATPATYSGNIVLTSTGAATVNVATVSSTVSTKALTISGATASNKEYDATNVAAITGSTLVGIVGSDVVTVSGTGTFVDANVGTAIAVTSTQTLGGANAAYYTLTLPSGLSANITTKALTITGLTANNKVFDGNTTATLSGTTMLNGVIPADVSNVTLGGTYDANFVTSAVGSGIAITVTGYTISGSAAGNYSLTQPTGLSADITSTPTPVINSSLTASGIYGVAISTYSITATETPTSFNATVLPAGLTINTSTGEITGTPTVVGTFNVTISATNAGGTGSATLVYTISPKVLTVTGATADSKEYDGNTNATISGSTLVGIVGLDDVIISNTGTFDTKNAGTAKTVTSTQTLSGAQAANYTLTLPTSLTANITPKVITIGAAAAQNKIFDGNTTATITGSLVGVISPDVVTLNLSGTFASSAVGVGIAVTSTSTITGTDAGNYALTQPSGLTANINAVPLYENTFTGASACPTNGNVPVVLSNATGTPLSRSTIACNSTANVFNSTTLNNTSSVNNSSYIQFSVSANTGYVLNVNSISFFRQASNSAPNQLEVRYSLDNFATSTSWGAAPLSTPTGTEITWDFTDFSTSIGGTVTFRIYPYGTQRADLTTGTAATSGTFRLDDVKVNGTVSASATPVISTTGTLSALTTTYGTPSSATTFNVSGADMTAGILVTSPSGFEVSLASGSGYASSITVGAAGTIASTPVYIRLAASTVAGTYSGNVVLTSAGVTAVNVATAPSTVNPADLPVGNLTANNKVFDGTTTATLSGTPVLIGLIPGDEPNVILGGTPVANFATSAVGTNIAVTVTGYTISGLASGNYTLVQPTGLTANITASPSPTITSALTASATYGVVATTYNITATETPTSYNATGLPAGLSVNTSTGEISGTPTVVGTFNVTISATNIGGTGSATLVYSINPKALTVTGAIADNKVYDRNTTASISGSTLVGIVGADVVTINGSGTFDTKNVGTSKAVTSTQTISGADAAKYTVTLPTGLVADITAKALTLPDAAAQNKPFDGNTNAVITGTLTGVIALDVVTLNGTGTFASSAIGTGIAVTSTSTIGGADAGNYSLTQPTGLSANILLGATTLAVGDISIIGFNLNAPDNFAFVTWVDINPDTYIKFTDNAFLSSASANATNNGRGGENFVIWKSGSSVIPAGTVISIQDNTAATTSTGTIVSGNLNGLSASGDNIFAYQGAATSGTNPDWSTNTNPTTFNGTILFGLYASGSSTLNSWLSTGTASANTSYLPSELNISTANIALGSLTSRGQYTASRSNQTSFANYKTMVNNTTNWTLGTGTGVITLNLTPFTLAATPVITSSGTLSALSATYGTASVETSFNVSGTDMTAGVLVTPPAGYEVSLTSGSGFSSTVTVGAAGTIVSTPVYVRLAATAIPGTYSGNIALTSAGAATVNVATVASTVSTKALTISGAIASNKAYDATNIATITGSILVGIVGSDVVTVSGTGTFADINVGTGIGVTSTQTLGGANASYYTLTLPTSLSADIAAKPLTISGLTADNKVYNGTTPATLSGTPSLVGVETVDISNVTLGGTYVADFATSAVGTGLSVIISGYTISGSAATNYLLTQPSGLTANITEAPLTIIGLTGVDKIYDRLTIATLSGTPSYVGLQNGETFSVTGTAVANFSDALVGAGKTITVTGYTAPTANYMVSQPTGITGAITTKPLTISGLTADNKLYDGNTTATLSGTPSLVGIIAPDMVNVTGTYTANFDDANIGTSKPVTVTGYSISGADASNYSVSQPTGLTADITSIPTPLITSTLTANGIYGVAISTYIITASNTPTGFNATGLPAGLSINTSTGEISGTPTVVGIFNTIISATNAGGSGSATLVFTIDPKTLTVTGATADSKIYNRTNAATISGSTLVGLVGADVVTISNTGTFATINAGTAIAVTSTQTLSGADAAKYTVTLPTGLSANITPKPLNVSGASVTTKSYDGTTIAAITGSTLVGVESPDVVTISGNGTFASADAGTAIAVTSSLVLGGADAGNYSLTQPTGLTGDITTAPLMIAGVTADNKVYDATINATLLGTASYSGLQNGETFVISGTPVATFNNKNVGTAKPVTVTGYTAPSTNYVVTQPTLTANITLATLTVSGAIADAKVYTRTTSATISGSTLVGVLGSDDVTISNTGTFASSNVGTAIGVTSTQTLSGADASNYSVTLPTSLTADITPKALTILGAAAQNKLFDGNTTATITGTLTGVIAPDVVTLTLSGTFASSAIGTGIVVTSTSTIGGANAANYSLTQPSGLLANITSVPTFTEVIFPQYIQGVNSTNNNRIPFAYRATVSNLNPNATYRFYNSVELTTALATATGAGNNIFAGATQGANFTYSTGPSLSTVGNYGTFTTDSNGSYSGWFIIAPSANATRFVPGTVLNTRIILNDGNNGTAVSTILKSNQTITVINTVSSAGATNGTGLWGASLASAKNFVFVYDDVAGSNRPLSGTFVESDGAAQVTSFASFYTANVDGTAGRYGMIIPNANSNGVRRIEQRDFSNGAIVGCPAIDANGIWPSGANTVNPTGGTTAIAITLNDAKLNASCVPTTSNQNQTVCSANLPYIWNGQSLSTDGTYTFVTLNSCGCDSTATLILTITPSSDNTTTITSCDTYTWANNGQTYTTSGTYTGTTTNCVTEKLVLTITPSSDNITTITACDTYTWANNGQTYTTSGTYTGTTTNCVTEKLVLTIIPSSDNITTITACDTYTWANNAQTYTTSGTYTGTTTNCVTEKLVLTITPSSDNITTITACDTYTWSNNGQTYTTSGTYTGTTTNCVTEKLVLTITPSSDNITTITACDTYTWANNAQTYTTSGTYTGTTTNCVTQKLVLTITPSSDNITTITACDTYTWANNGQTYTTSGTYTGTTYNCVTQKLVLTITPSSDNITTITACDTYTWANNGQTYTTSGTYTGTTTNCVTQKLVLTITPSSDNITTITACDTYTWANNGQTYTTSGTYTGTTTNCVTQKLLLTITPSSDNITTITACDTYTWSNNGQTYTTSGTYTGTTSNCVTQKLVLTITPSSDNITTITACDTYTWSNNGQTYTTSGTYTGTTTNCVTQKLVLTITPSSDNITTITTCDTFTWANNGQTYTTSGTYTGTTTNCVTQKLVLTITPSSDNITTITACDTYTWANNGQTYTTSGTYIGTTTNCVTQKLVLIITPSSDNITTITACNTYTWANNGQTYTTSGTYTGTTANCVTQKLVLTINNSTTSSLTISAAGSYTWSANNQTYTMSGTYTHVSTNAQGCSHTATLILTITGATNATLNLTMFIQGYWNGTGMVAARYDNLVSAGASNPGNSADVDEVTIELRHPSTFAVIFTSIGMLQTNGALQLTFPQTSIGNSYYVVVKHQNSLQTWSSNPLLISATTSYNFSNSLSKAYSDGSADPMATLATGVFGLYSGDLNQDEFIDASDYPVFETDVFNSSFMGLFNLPSDLNGDTFVDATDYPIFDLSSSLGLYTQRP